MLEIRTSEPMKSRPCKYSLTMQDDSVIADFDMGGDTLFLVRISFDGYGCCNPTPDAGLSRFSKQQSVRLIKAINANTFTEVDVQELLKAYLTENSNDLWPDSLKHHNLI